MNKPKLGDKFFFVVKNYKEARAITVYVKKVGSKYFWVGHQYEKAKCFWFKFCIENHSDANQYGSYDLYKTEQDYRDHQIVKAAQEWKKETNFDIYLPPYITNLTDAIEAAEQDGVLQNLE